MGKANLVLKKSPLSFGAGFYVLTVQLFNSISFYETKNENLL